MIRLHLTIFHTMCKYVIWSLLVSLLTMCGTSNAASCYLTPDICPNEDIKFWLYKNATRDTPILLDLQNLTSDMFEPRLPLKIIIHGLNGSRDFSPNLEIRPALLQTQPVNVISVDYQPLARILCYIPWGVANARTVSKCLAQLIDNLVRESIYAREDIHLIGFSLGAQIAGLTSNYAQTRLSRITGLDAARAGFTTYTLSDKLDSTDADFVDVVHTNPNFLAYLSPIGHVDFYPNFGGVSQPGCNVWENGGIIICDHYRANIYYAESITTEVGFWAYNCGNWLEYLLNRCINYGHMPHEQMGYFVSRNATGSYFLKTHATAPYAMGQLADVDLEVVENELN